MAKAYKALPPASELWELFDYSIITGQLFYKTGPKKGCPAGGFNPRGKQRINVRAQGQPWGVHQVVWKMITGSDAGQRIDHHDRNPHNNAWINLRLATHAENMKNRTGVKGYYKHSTGSGWVAQIVNGSQWQYLGYYSTEAKARAAYEKASKRLHGEFSSV